MFSVKKVMLTGTGKHFWGRRSFHSHSFFQIELKFTVGVNVEPMNGNETRCERIADLCPG
jgi:hypothetical protein